MKSFSCSWSARSSPRPPARLATPVPVKTTRHNEVSPSAGGDWLVWSRSRQRRVSPFDLFAQHANDPAFRVNRKGTQAYGGGIDGTRLLYQLIRGQYATQSDLRLYDLQTRRLKTLPAGINTKNWECCGTISGDWILFSRGRAYGPPTQRDHPRQPRHRRAARGRPPAQPQRRPQRRADQRELRGVGPLRPVPAVRHLPLRPDDGLGDGAPHAAGEGGLQPVRQPVRDGLLRAKHAGLRQVGGARQADPGRRARGTGFTAAGTRRGHHVRGDAAVESAAARTSTHVHYDTVLCKKQTWDIYRVDDSSGAHAHSLALKGDGTVVAWGCGSGSTTSGSAACRAASPA